VWCTACNLFAVILAHSWIRGPEYFSPCFCFKPLNVSSKLLFIPFCRFPLYRWLITITRIMIGCTVRISVNDPPQVPLITDHVKKKGQESLTEALAGAAVAFAKAFSLPVCSSQPFSTFSPCKAAELRIWSILVFTTTYKRQSIVRKWAKASDTRCSKKYTIDIICLLIN